MLIRDLLAGKTITVAAAKSLCVRANVQGPWLSSHGLLAIIGLVKSWSFSEERAVDEGRVDGDQILTVREFTRCLLLAAHVTFCGSQQLDATAEALAGSGGLSMHAALWALLAEMERSPYCTQVRVSRPVWVCTLPVRRHSSMLTPRVVCSGASGSRRAGAGSGRRLGPGRRGRRAATANR